MNDICDQPLKIIMARGDIETQRFFIYYTEDEICTSTINEIYFTVKSSFENREYIFQKRLTNGDITLLDDGSYQFSIMPEDTNNMDVGRYVFDIEVVGDGIKKTWVGKLILTNEVTYAENEV